MIASSAAVIVAAGCVVVVGEDRRRPAARRRRSSRSPDVPRTAVIEPVFARALPSAGVPFMRFASVPSRPAIGSDASNGPRRRASRSTCVRIVDERLRRDEVVARQPRAVALNQRAGRDAPALEDRPARPRQPAAAVGTTPGAAASVFSNVSAYRFWLIFISRTASADSGGDRYETIGAAARRRRVADVVDVDRRTAHVDAVGDQRARGAR